jgi:hypothetical protein
MTSPVTTLAPGSALLAALLLPLPARAGEPSPSSRPPARLYTNADLERVHPFRDETGVRSVPAFAAPDRTSAATADRPRSRGESYWRDEARRVREKIAALAEKAAELRARIAADEDERRHLARSSRSARSRAALGGGPDPTSLARLAALERRMRALEDDLEERARRDGALPGWLR